MSQRFACVFVEEQLTFPCCCADVPAEFGTEEMVPLANVSGKILSKVIELQVSC